MSHAAPMPDPGRGGPRLGPDHPLRASLIATAVAAAAGLLVAVLTNPAAVVRSLHHLAPGWLAIGLALGVVGLPSYTLAYRSTVWLLGHWRLTVLVTLEMVLAGFGPFALLGGFAHDQLGLRRLGADRAGARSSMLALGAIELTTLAAAAFAASVVMLCTGSSVMGSMLWPWAIGVPVGAAVTRWLPVVAMRRHPQLGHGRRRMLGGIASLRAVLAEAATLRVAWLGVLLYWSADVLSLDASLHAVGVQLGVGPLIVGYASGYLASRRTLPLAGAGVLEVLLTVSLHWVGVALADALVAVLLYRVVNLVLLAALASEARHRLTPLMQTPAGS